MTLHEFIGIDIAKEKFDVYLQKKEGSSVQGLFKNTQEGFKELLVWIKKYSDSPWIGMESTGHYGEPLAEFLLDKGFKVSVINPLQIKYFGKVKLSRNKNDRVDAQLIAHYVEAMNPPLFKARSPEQKYIRELIQLEETLIHQRTQLKLQRDCSQSLQIRKEFEKTLKMLDKRLESLAQTLETAVKNHSEWAHLIELLTSVKGIGRVSAYRFLAYIPDIHSFKNAKQLAAFIGVSPQQKESGKYKGQTKLSKRGNSRLRSILYMPALNAKRFNPALQPFVTRLKDKGLAPKAIIGAVMRKLVHIIFGILKSDAIFNPDLV